MLAGHGGLGRHFTFALPDFEEAEGWTLLCRAHAYSDLEIELINYDEEVINSGSPIRTVQTRVTAVEPLTHDIRALRLRIEGDEPLSYRPGQYVDVGIPGHEAEQERKSVW